MAQPDSNLDDLCPTLLPLAGAFVSQCRASGLHCRITITWRDPSAQDAAHAAGLSNAAAGQSPHNCCNADGTPASRAFDFALFDDNAAYIANGTDPRYAQAGAIAKGLGLAWGGDWHHPDYDHVELANWRAV